MLWAVHYFGVCQLSMLSNHPEMKRVCVCRVNAMGFHCDYETANCLWKFWLKYADTEVGEHGDNTFFGYNMNVTNILKQQGSETTKKKKKKKN